MASRKFDLGWCRGIILLPIALFHCVGQPTFPEKNLRDPFANNGQQKSRLGLIPRDRFTDNGQRGAAVGSTNFGLRALKLCPKAGRDIDPRHPKSKKFWNSRVAARPRTPRYTLFQLRKFNYFWINFALLIFSNFVAQKFQKPCLQMSSKFIKIV